MIPRPDLRRPDLPPARHLDLPGRGRTWVYDTGAGDHPAGSSGAGKPTLLLLHGWTSSAALNWSGCFEPLSTRYRAVALDHRGHGRGIRSRRPFRLEDCADDAAALVEEMGLGPVILVGYSMGGPVALLLWRRHREMAAGLVLCATAASFPTSRRWSGWRGDLLYATSLTLSMTPARLRRQGMAAVVDRRVDRSTARWAAEEWARHDPATLMQGGRALSRFDATGWTGEIDVPAVVVVTEHDTTVRPRRQTALAAAIPGALTVEVAAGHRACAEQADLFVPALIRGLEAVSHRTRQEAGTS